MKRRVGLLTIPRRPVLKREEMERKGPQRPREIRTGEDVEKIFLTVFNIRGVTFGNYVPDNGERQLNASPRAQHRVRQRDGHRHASGPDRPEEHVVRLLPQLQQVHGQEQQFR